MGRGFNDSVIQRGRDVEGWGGFGGQKRARRAERLMTVRPLNSMRALG
jgi:hypothetical protein